MRDKMRDKILLFLSTLSKHFIKVVYQQSGRVVLKLSKNYTA